MDRFKSILKNLLFWLVFVVAVFFGSSAIYALIKEGLGSIGGWGSAGITSLLLFFLFIARRPSFIITAIKTIGVLIFIAVIIFVGMVLEVPKRFGEQSFFNATGKALKNNVTVEWGKPIFTDKTIDIKVKFINNDEKYPFEVSYISFQKGLAEANLDFLDAEPKQASAIMSPEAERVYYFKDQIIEPKKSKIITMKIAPKAAGHFEGGMRTTVKAYKPDVSQIGIFSVPSEQYKTNVNFDIKLR